MQDPHPDKENPMRDPVVTTLIFPYHWMGGQVDPHNKVLGLRGGRREDEKELNSLGLEEFSGCLRRMEPNQAQDRSGQEKKAASEMRVLCGLCLDSLFSSRASSEEWIFLWLYLFRCTS